MLVGAVVALAEKAGKPLNQLTLAELQSVDQAFGRDALGVFDLQRAMAKRNLTGAPGTKEVAKQLARNFGEWAIVANKVNPADQAIPCIIRGWPDKAARLAVAPWNHGAASCRTGSNARDNFRVLPGPRNLPALEVLLRNQDSNALWNQGNRPIPRTTNFRPAIAAAPPPRPNP